MFLELLLVLGKNRVEVERCLRIREVSMIPELVHCHEVGKWYSFELCLPIPSCKITVEQSNKDNNLRE